MTTCAIKHHNLRPIPGGWGLDYFINGEKFEIRGPTPQRIVDAIAQIQNTNGVFEGYHKIWNYCNTIWCERAPERALVHFPKKPKPAPAGPRRDHWKHGPEKFGPIMWYWLHSFGMVFNAEHWRAALERITNLLDPEKNPENGCVTCFAEWRAIMATESPFEVNSEAAAAQWTFNVHNRINKKLGYRQFSFEIAAKLYGWKVDL